MEALKITGMIIAFSLVYGYVNNEDYHSKFDNYEKISYNCSNLVDGYHPNVPQEVFEECQNKNRREVIVYIK
jgi:hypothetical protein